MARVVTDLYPACIIPGAAIGCAAADRMRGENAEAFLLDPCSAKRALA
jgi:hypothetical protein